jgi:hypothetical protein
MFRWLDPWLRADKVTRLSGHLCWGKAAGTLNHEGCNSRSKGTGL